MGIHITRRLDDATRDEVTRLADAAAQTDGVAPLSEQARLHLTDEEGGWLHVLAQPIVDGPIAGYAHIEVPEPGEPGVPGAELVVHPQLRRRGTGSAILAAVHGHSPTARVWAHGYLPAAQEFARAHDMGVVRELWHMTLTREAAGDAVAEQAGAPEGYVVDTYTPDDAQALLATNAAAFVRHAEQGRMSLADVRAREAEPWFDPEGLFLLRRADSGTDAADRVGAPVAAFHWTKVEDGVGEVYVVGVHPDEQGHGLGGAATRIGLAHLWGRGVPAIGLYVDGDNEAAIATYLRQGFERDALDVQLAPSGR